MNVDLIVTIIKNFFINFFIYYTFFRITNIKINNTLQKIKILLGIVLTTLLHVYVQKYLNQLCAISASYYLQILFLNMVTKEKQNMTTILVANAATYIIFGISAIIEYPIQRIFNISNMIINSCINLAIEAIILFYIFKIKRFSKGIIYLKNKSNNSYINSILINIAIMVMFTYSIFEKKNVSNAKNIFIPFIILGIIMLIMIQKTLTLYYKQKQMVKTLKEYEDNIKTKDEQIQKLSDEKFKISKLNHEFYNRQKALELKVEELVSNANLNIETAGEISIVEQINKLSKEYSNKLETIKNLDKLPTTEIEEIDDMLKYMQSECKKNNIDFKLQINGNIHHMVNNFIPQDKLVTLIGDHLRDAIIAITSSNNTYKSIVAILGIKDDCYEFCVNDTGREFEIETLLKLGLEPVTTYEDAGGSGLGFMTTFETLKETKASLIIEEKYKMTANDYTKAVIIRFDRKNEYKIVSYRADEIKKKLKDNRIVLENIDKNNIEKTIGM